MLRAKTTIKASGFELLLFILNKAGWTITVRLILKIQLILVKTNSALIVTNICKRIYLLAFPITKSVRPDVRSLIHGRDVGTLLSSTVSWMGHVLTSMLWVTQAPLSCEPLICINLTYTYIRNFKLIHLAVFLCLLKWKEFITGISTTNLLTQIFCA